MTSRKSTTRKTPDDYHALAERRDFRWLGPEVPNNKTKTGWQCEHGHQWEACYHNIQHGSGCPTCARNVRAAPRRKKPVDYLAFAEERGFHWLGPEVSNVHTKTWWECEQGHRWEACYSAVRKGSGCPFCAGVAPKTSDDYHALAAARGFQWLGPQVPNTMTKTWWECQHGHQWEMRYNHIKQGQGCPFCAGVALKTPDDYHALAAEYGIRWLGPIVLTTKTKTWWECSRGHQWEAWYHNIKHGSGCPVCARQRLRELTRKGGARRWQRKTPSDYHSLAEERGFRWLGPKVANTHTKTRWQCEHGHQWEARFGNVSQGTGCPSCAGVARKTSDDYRALATERGFQWLGPQVANVQTKTEWECQHGHRWQARYNNIRHGAGCPFCAGTAPKTPADYHALAKERGFRWLGSQVINVRKRTTWECEHGHQWEACFSNVRQGTGCPVCAGQAPKTPADYHDLARKRGFRWLGPQVPNVQTRTGWECGQGHQWQAPYANIRHGTGCPACARNVRAAQRRKKPADYHALIETRPAKE